MNKLKMLLASIVFAMGAGGAHAAVYYGDKVIDANRGTCTISAARCAQNDRLNTNNSLGTTDGSFYSLGLGGDLTVGFARSLFTGAANIRLFETTFGSIPGTNHFEAVDVWSVLAGVETFLGTITNLGGGGQVRSVAPFEYIKLVDVTLREFAVTTSRDGFDTDSVSIAAIPLPATGILLLAGLGGMAAMRRRKNIAA